MAPASTWTPIFRSDSPQVAPGEAQMQMAQGEVHIVNAVPVGQPNVVERTVVAAVPFGPVPTVTAEEVAGVPLPGVRLPLAEMVEHFRLHLGLSGTMADVVEQACVQLNVSPPPGTPLLRKAEMAMQILGVPRAGSREA